MDSDADITSQSMLSGVSKGDQQSWQRLVDLYRPLIFKELRKILYQFSHADADDIAQNVFLVLFHRVSSFENRGPGSFRAFLREISRRQALAWIYRRTPSQLPVDFAEAEVNTSLREWADPWSQLNLSFDAEHDQYWKEKILEEAKLRCGNSRKLKRSYSVFLEVTQGGKLVRDVAHAHGMSTATGYRAVHDVRAVVNQIRSDWSEFL